MKPRLLWLTALLALLLAAAGLVYIRASTPPPPVETSTPVPTAEPTPTPEPTPCPHTWADGVCTLCGERCVHEEHSADGLCTRCGEKVFHSYRNGVCACGAVPQFLTMGADMPDYLFEESSQQGSLQEIFYDRVSLEVSDKPENPRSFVVYTPYGYDPSQRYDVLILNHGMGDNVHFWLEDSHIFATGKHWDVTGKLLFDAMIERGEIRPLIVVAVTYSAKNPFAEIRPEFTRALRECILPYLAEHYSVYGSVGSDGTLDLEREHFALVGFSLASMMNWESVIADDLDYIAYWGNFSGNVTTPQQLVDILGQADTERWPIDYLYASVGGVEADRYRDESRYTRSVELCDELVEGENCHFDVIDHYPHRFDTWYVSLYNCMQVFFLNQYAP